jgi:predicted nucleic acid-binding protein
VIYFLDTSALIKRYIDEPGSDQVRRLMRRARVELAVARVTEAEAYAAIARAVRMNVITGDERDRAFVRLEADLATMRTVEIRRPLVAAVRELVVRWPLRGYDAVQLACSLRLADEGLAVDLWAADGDLIAAARGEGLRTTVV